MDHYLEEYVEETDAISRVNVLRNWKIVCLLYYECSILGFDALRSRVADSNDSAKCTALSTA